MCFSHLFYKITYNHVRFPFVQKEKNKKTSLKFRRSKSEIFRPPLFEIGSSWARYFRSGIPTYDVIFLTRDWFTFDRHFCQSGFYLPGQTARDSRW